MESTSKIRLFEDTFEVNTVYPAYNNVHRIKGTTLVSKCDVHLDIFNEFEMKKDCRYDMLITTSLNADGTPGYDLFANKSGG